MQITPVSYNYSNKTQKNNSKPAFGMSLSSRMAEHIGADSDKIIKLGAEGKQSLLDNIGTMIGHYLEVGVPNNNTPEVAGKFRIYSVDGRRFRPVEQGITDEVTFDNIARELGNFNTLDRNVLAQGTLAERNRQEAARQAQLIVTARETNKQNLLSGRLLTQKDCQDAEEAVTELEQSLALKNGNAQEIELNLQRARAAKYDFFTKQTEDVMLDPEKR